MALPPLLLLSFNLEIYEPSSGDRRNDDGIRWKEGLINRRFGYATRIVSFPSRGMEERKKERKIRIIKRFGLPGRCTIAGDEKERELRGVGGENEDGRMVFYGWLARMWEFLSLWGVNQVSVLGGSRLGFMEMDGFNFFFSDYRYAMSSLDREKILWAEATSFSTRSRIPRNLLGIFLTQLLFFSTSPRRGDRLWAWYHCGIL